MTHHDLQLVHVTYGEDEGLVSLALGQVLCHAYGHARFAVPDGTPHAYLSDLELDAASGGEATWDDVPDYLRRNPGIIGPPKA